MLTDADRARLDNDWSHPDHLSATWYTDLTAPERAYIDGHFDEARTLIAGLVAWWQRFKRVLRQRPAWAVHKPRTRR